MKPFLYVLLVVMALALAFQTGYLVHGHHSGRATEKADSGAKYFPPVPAMPPAATQAPIRQSYDWDPFEDMRRMQEQMDRVFGSGFAGMGDDMFSAMSRGSSFEPKADMQQTPDAYVLTLEVPGMEDDSLRVKAEGDTLIISGQRERQNESQSGGVQRFEQSIESFQRILPLPPDADGSRMEGDSQNGIVTIRIPKRSTASVPSIA